MKESANKTNVLSSRLCPSHSTGLKLSTSYASQEKFFVRVGSRSAWNCRSSIFCVKFKSCRICERYQGKRWSSSCMNFRIVRSVGRNVLLGMCFLAKIAIKSYWGMIKVFGYVYRMISSALALKADNIAVSESWLWPLRRATRLSGCLMVMLVCSTEMLRPKISESSASSSSMGCS